MDEPRQAVTLSIKQIHELLFNVARFKQGNFRNTNGLIEKVLLAVQRSVCASTGAAATACAAMMVLAPGLFSTMTGWVGYAGCGQADL